VTTPGRNGTTRIWRWLKRETDSTPDDSVEFYEGTLADGFDDDPGHYDPRPDPRTHPEFWTE
jgi:hypothetical protein